MGFMRIDFRYVEIEYELWALGHYMGFVESQIAYLHEQDQLRTLTELREKGWEHDEAEWQLAHQELDETKRYVIPRFTRGPFIVSLWACFEAGLHQLADGRQQEVGAQRSLRDERRGTILQKAKRYFTVELGTPIDRDQARYNRLTDLLRVRNSLAHGNGQRHAMKRSAWASLTAALKRQGVPLDEYRDVVVLSDAYLRTAYEDVNGCLRDLVLRMRTPPTRS